MSAGGFGRKGMSGDDEMARRREAFIAAERARQANPAPEESAVPSARLGFATPSPASFRLPKSVGTAYLLWFVLGQMSAHRHYLGYHNTALAQSGLLIGGWLLVFTGNLSFLIAPLLGGLWVLADAFTIPSMCRDANARARGQNVQHVFA